MQRFIELVSADPLTMIAIGGLGIVLLVSLGLFGFIMKRPKAG
jgi:hypothetical protein